MILTIFVMTPQLVNSFNESSKCLDGFLVLMPWVESLDMEGMGWKALDEEPKMESLGWRDFGRKLEKRGWTSWGGEPGMESLGDRVLFESLVWRFRDWWGGELRKKMGGRIGLESLKWRAWGGEPLVESLKIDELL